VISIMLAAGAALVKKKVEAGIGSLSFSEGFQRA